MSFSQTINYNIPTNFTFDSTKISVSDLNASLKTVRPANSTFYAGFLQDINGDYGNGVLTGTAVGSPSVANGYLDLRGAGKYVSWPYPQNASNDLVGTVRFKIIPNYSNNPTQLQMFFCITADNDSSSSNNNLFELYHDTTGSIFFRAFDSIGNGIISTSLAAWAPVSGTAYEWEIDYNFQSSGTTIFFVNGAQFGGQKAGSGTRTAGTGTRFFRSGAGSGAVTANANFQITDIILFSTLQHNTAFTSEIPRAKETLYPITSPVIEANSGVAVTDITNLTESSSVPSGTSITYVMNVAGTSYYWDGTAWIVSNQTLAQSNPASTIVANISQFRFTQGVTVVFIALLTSTYGRATPVLTSNVITYDLATTPPNPPAECIVYLSAKDILGDLIADTATLTVTLAKSFVHTDQIIAAGSKSVNFINGYAAISIVETASLTPSPNYVFSVTYPIGSSTGTILFNAAAVPNTQSADLLSFATLK